MRKLLAIALLLFSSQAWGATYYVRADGTVTAANKVNATSCSAAGTALNMAQHNAATFAAGDTITLCGDGGNFTTVLTVPTTGTEGNVITYVGSGSAVLDGNDSITTLIQSYSKNYITFRAFSLTNTAVADDGVIKIYQSSYNVLDNLTINGTAGRSAVWLIDSTSHTTIQNCTISNHTHGGNTSYGSGIFANTTGGYTTIDNCIIHSNYLSGIEKKTDAPEHNLWIKNNTIYNNGSAGIGIVGNQGADPDNMLIEHNHIYENGQTQNDTGNIHLFEIGDSNIIRYNITHDQNYISVASTEIFLDSPTNAAYWGTGNQFYYNIMYGGYDGLTFLGADGTVAYNNTIYNMSHIGLKVHGSIAQNNLIKNNIVHTAATQLVYEVDGSSNTINYNLYYDATLTNKFKHDASTYSTLADWRTASGQDANSPSVADPLFISTVTPDFHLQSGSPAINAGVDVGLTEDYLGNPVPYLGGKVDIGAYEFQSGDPWAIGGGGRFPSFPTFPSFPSWR